MIDANTDERLYRTMSALASVMDAMSRVIRGCRQAGIDVEDAEEVLAQADSALMLAADAASRRVVGGGGG